MNNFNGLALRLIPVNSIMLCFQATWYLRYHTNGPTVDLVTHQGMLVAQEGTLMAWQGHLRTGFSYWNAYEFKTIPRSSCKWTISVLLRKTSNRKSAAGGKNFPREAQKKGLRKKHIWPKLHFQRHFKSWAEFSKTFNALKRESRFQRHFKDFSKCGHPAESNTIFASIYRD